MLKSNSIKLGVQQKMKKRKYTRKIKNPVRVALSTHLARVMAYYDKGYVDVAQFHSRKLVEELIKLKLLDPVMPLRPMEPVVPTNEPG